MGHAGTFLPSTVAVDVKMEPGAPTTGDKRKVEEADLEEGATPDDVELDAPVDPPGLSRPVPVMPATALQPLGGVSSPIPPSTGAADVRMVSTEPGVEGKRKADDALLDTPGGEGSGDDTGEVGINPLHIAPLLMLIATGSQSECGSETSSASDSPVSEHNTAPVPDSQVSEPNAFPFTPPSLSPITRPDLK